MLVNLNLTWIYLVLAVPRAPLGTEYRCGAESRAGPITMSERTRATRATPTALSSGTVALVLIVCARPRCEPQEVCMCAVAPLTYVDPLPSSLCLAL